MHGSSPDASPAGSQSAGQRDWLIDSGWRDALARIGNATVNTTIKILHQAVHPKSTLRLLLDLNFPLSASLQLIFWANCRLLIYLLRPLTDLLNVFLDSTPRCVKLSA